MKKKLTLFFIIILILHYGSIFAQKHDYMWMLGKDSEANPDFAGAIIDFNGDSTEIYTFFQDLYFYQTNASICDTAGNLLFYTNGLKIANALGDIMENGEGLNPGPHADSQQDYGYILDQGAIIVPMPGSDSLYYLIHADKQVPPNQIFSKWIYYSLIDMSLNNGLGAVIQKNEIIREGVFEQGKLTLTHHANGIDWWLVFRQYNSNKYYKYLITTNGIVSSDSQIIGDSIPSPGVGQAVFSPDGTRYANLYIGGGVGNDFHVSIYDFDRCTGDLYNTIQFTYADSAWSGGLAISPNSRFLYVSSYKYVYQYDLWATDIAASKDTVAIYDGFVVPSVFATTFSLAQLAPDGKIYITSNNSVPYLHVINYPDLPGDSCQVCQHCVELPTWNAFSIPNFPNYRLGPTEEACVTAVADFEVLQEDLITIYPNPARDEATIDWSFHPFETGTIQIFDVNGKLLKRLTLARHAAKIRVNTADLQAGIYLVTLQLDQRQPITKKLVILQR